MTWAWIEQHLWERKWDDVIELCDTIPSDSPLEVDAVWFRASAVYFRDGPDAGRPEIEKALEIVAAALEESEDNRTLHSRSAWLHSCLGEPEAALREVEIVLELAGIKGAGIRMATEEDVAMVYAAIGREDQALDILERLLGSNYPGAITVHELRHIADWDPIRDHPRFQALMEKFGQEG